MPFINGRFYANPIFGKGVERARDTESDDEFNDKTVRPGMYGDLQFADPVARYGTDNDTDESAFQLDSAQHDARAKQHPAQKQAHQKHPYVTVYPHEKKIGGSASWRNNNPANIHYGRFAHAHGAIGKDYRGRAIFPTMEAGDKAQDALWRGGTYQHLTIASAAKRWASTAPPDTQKKYAESLSKAVGASPNTPISNLKPDQLNRLKKAQQRQEGFQLGITEPIPHKP